MFGRKRHQDPAVATERPKISAEAVRVPLAGSDEERRAVAIAIRSLMFDQISAVESAINETIAAYSGAAHDVVTSALRQAFSDRHITCEGPNETAIAAMISKGRLKPLSLTTRDDIPSP